MKIVFLSPAAQRGGAEAVLLGLLGALRKAHPAWIIRVLSGENGPLLEKIGALGIPHEVIAFPDALRTFGENRPRPGSLVGEGEKSRLRAQTARLIGWLQAGVGALRYAWKLRWRLRQLRPDLLHSNGMKMHLLGALTKPPRCPLVWHLHDYLNDRPTMKRLLRWPSRQCALAIAISKSIAADARLALPGLARIDTLHNAVDLDVFNLEGAVLDLDRLAGLPPPAPNTVRVGLVATFAFWKGHEVFLRAAARLGREHLPSDVRFYIIGGPIYATAGSQYTQEELAGLAETLGLRGQVGFTGFVEKADEAMRALDVVVHASTGPEPFGLVVVQAMACGRAMIVSAAGGAAELIEPGINALTHAPGQVGELASAIGRLAADSALRTRLAAAGRAHVEEHFGRERQARTLVALLESLLPAERGAP